MRRPREERQGGGWRRDRAEGGGETGLRVEERQGGGETGRRVEVEEREGGGWRRDRAEGGGERRSSFSLSERGSLALPDACLVR